MSYMLLIVEPTGQRAERTEAQGREAYGRMKAFGDALRAQGKLKAVESLAGMGEAVRVSRARCIASPAPVAAIKRRYPSCQEGISPSTAATVTRPRALAAARAGNLGDT